MLIFRGVNPPKKSWKLLKYEMKCQAFLRLFEERFTCMFEDFFLQTSGALAKLCARNPVDQSYLSLSLCLLLGWLWLIFQDFPIRILRNFRSSWTLSLQHSLVLLKMCHEQTMHFFHLIIQRITHGVHLVWVYWQVAGVMGLELFQWFCVYKCIHIICM